MALIFPKDIETLEPTDSEIVAFNCLSQLSDDYIVVYSVPWLNKNQKTKRLIQGESDFLVIKKNVGFVCIEVKGGVGIECSGNEWSLILSSEIDTRNAFLADSKIRFERKLKKSPYQQSREGMYYFLNYFNEFYGRRYSSCFGYAVMFPNYTVDVKGWPDANEDITIDSKGLINLEDKIETIFANLEKTQTYKQKEDVLLFSDLLLKQRLFNVLTSDYVRAGDRFFKEISEVQNYLISFLSQTPRAAIYGAAGTGKTYLARKKASELIKQKKNVLYLCFNSFLAEFVKNDFLEKKERVEVMNFHMLVKDSIGKDNFIKLISEGTLQLKGIEGLLDRLGLRLKKYDFIILDEGQDFQLEWLNSLNNYFLENEAGFYIFYDSEQDVFRNQLNTFLSEKSIPQFFLPSNLRNTKEIHQYFVNKTGLGKNSISNKLIGSPPEALVFYNALELVADLKSLVETLVDSHGVLPSRILILSTRDKGRSWISDLTKIAGYPIKQIESASFHLDDNQIPFATVQSFKGLEADIVIFLNQPSSEDLESKNLEYVAMSRAKFFLFEYRLVTP